MLFFCEDPPIRSFLAVLLSDTQMLQGGERSGSLYLQTSGGADGWLHQIRHTGRVRDSRRRTFFLLFVAQLAGLFMLLRAFLYNLFLTHFPLLCPCRQGTTFFFSIRARAAVQSSRMGGFMQSLLPQTGMLNQCGLLLFALPFWPVTDRECRCWW